MSFFDRERPFAIRQGSLPHWDQAGVYTFVTFRLADSLPQRVMRPWQMARLDWLAHHPEPWDEATESEYHERFTDRFHEFLDAGYGSCVLALPEAAEIVATALRFFDGERYQLDEWCIAPNHVHAVMTPLGESQMPRILHSWKSYTGHEIAKLPRAAERLGVRYAHRVWQKESFDHLVRSAASLERIRHYIARHRR